MSSIRRVLFVGLVAVLAGLCLVACGGNDDSEPESTKVVLPDDFPSDQVPLVPGALQSADKTDGTWQVTMAVQAGGGNPVEAATKLLKDKGFTESNRVDTGSDRLVSLTKKDGGTTYYVDVGITTASAGGASVVFYNVSTSD